MNFIPFHPDIAKPIVERITREYAAAKHRKPGDRTEYDWPAYRLPDGTIRIVYDLYRPDYPEGSTPGIADCAMRLCYYPNDTRSYEHFPFNFRPFN